MRSTKTKLLLISIIMIFSFSFLLTNGVTLAAGGCGVDTNIIDCGAEVDNTIIEKNAIFVLLKRVIVTLSGLVGIVAVAMMIVAGVMYATAGDKDGQVTAAKNMMRNTIIGVLLYVFMTVILNFLVPGGLIGENQSETPNQTSEESTNGPTKPLVQ